MKKNLLKGCVLPIVVAMLALSSHAQDKRGVKEKVIGENGLPKLIVFDEKATYKQNDAQKVFQEQLGLKENASFAKIRSEADNLGFTHEKFQLFYQGVKIEFATYTLHSKSGKLESMSGEFYKLNNINVAPALSKTQALQRAMIHTGAAKYLWDDPQSAAALGYTKPEGELVLLPVFEGESTAKDQLRLAYKFDIYAVEPISRGDLYIDAVTGKALFYNATIKHATHFGHTSDGLVLPKKNCGHSHAADNEKAATALQKIVAGNAATRYSGAQTIETTLSGSVYILKDATRGSGINTYNLQTGSNFGAAINFQDNDNNWTTAEHSVNKNNAALDAHWGAEKTYDYWQAKHGRNSYNNSGAAINSYVHYQYKLDNAYWNGSAMLYGDGSDTYFDALTALDVAGHEIGHAVCTYTANLAYQRESGAMNEGFSDIWGAAVEYYAAPNKATWLIGEDIERRSGHAALRSMSNPKSEGQPNTYGGTYWVNPNCGTPTLSNDYCGVHTNSGVLNHWFYILAVGKSGTNDIGSTYNVTGITIDKAAKIAYRLESVYLSANSTFANARTYGIQAAVDLYGAGSAEVIATTNAFYAVGIGAAYAGTTDTTAPTAPTNLIASNITANSVVLTWNAATDNVAVTGYNIYNGTNLVTTVTGLTTTVTGLTASTAYTFSVKAKDAAGNLSVFGNAVSVTTAAGSGTAYCTSKGSNASYEYIDYVALNNMVNTTASNSGYGNFTNLVANLPYGANTIYISAGFASTAYTEYWNIWIDYNKNGTFETSEKVVAGSSASNATLSATFTVPTTASAGTTRMRVSMKYGADATACETFSYGEVEDYTVNIGAAAIQNTIAANILGSEKNNFDFVLYPNPVNEVLQVTLADSRPVTFRVINLLGQEIQQGELTDEGINMAKLNAGTYLFEINDGQKVVTKKFLKQ